MREAGDMMWETCVRHESDSGRNAKAGVLWYLATVIAIALGSVALPANADPITDNAMPVTGDLITSQVEPESDTEFQDVDLSAWQRDTSSKVDSDNPVVVSADIPLTRAPSPALPVVPPPGTAVPHQVDVVYMAVRAAGDDTPLRNVPSQSEVVAHLDIAAQWWTENTGRTIDFTTGVRFASTKITCEQEAGPAAMEALGLAPTNWDYYTESSRDLVILLDDIPDCTLPTGAVGIAYTVPTQPSITTGGVLAVTADLDELLGLAIAHEFGHTIGLMHSNYMDCAWVTEDDVIPLGPIWDEQSTQGRCSVTEYGDPFTIMGGLTRPAPPKTLSAGQKYWLGLAADDPQIVVTDQLGVHDYTITKHSSNGGLQGLIIKGGNWGGLYGGIYSIDYRGPYELGHGWVMDAPGGVTVTSVGQATILRSPIGGVQWPSGGYNWTGLLPGETFTSADRSVSITTLSMTADTAVVRVSISEFPGARGSVQATLLGSTLSATLSWGGLYSSVTYQWLRNGQPIPGATEASYEVPMPDPNAVFAVTATITDPGVAPTTLRSHGVIVDDQRITVSSGPKKADGVDAYTLTGHPIDGYGQPTLSPIVGIVEHGDTGFRHFSFTQQTPDGGFTIEVTSTLPGWVAVTFGGQLPETRLFFNSAPGARLTVGGSPATDSTGQRLGILNVDNPGGGELPAVVYVADNDGNPQPGVPVTFSGDEGLKFTPAVPITGVDGFAWTTISWQGEWPNGLVLVNVHAFVAGSEVDTSPAEVQVIPGMNGPGQIYGPNSTLTVTQDPDVWADGIAQQTATITARDFYGDPVEGATFYVHFRNGEKKGVTDANGTASVPVTALDPGAMRVMADWDNSGSTYLTDWTTFTEPPLDHRPVFTVTPSSDHAVIGEQIILRLRGRNGAGQPADYFTLGVDCRTPGGEYCTPEYSFSSMNGGEGSITVSFQEEGVYLVSVKRYNEAGQDWDFDGSPVTITVRASAEPDPPIVAIANGTKISGTAPAGSTVAVTYPIAGGLDNQVEVPVDNQGNWSVPTPQDAIDGVITSIAFFDLYYVSSPALDYLDVTPPTAPVVAVANETMISGTSEAEIRVVIKNSDGLVLADIEANANGIWMVPTPQPVPSEISVTAIDDAGNESEPTVITVTVRPPDPPIILSPLDGDVIGSRSVTISGIGEPGATVTVKYAASVVCTAEVPNTSDWACSGDLPDGAYSLIASQIHPTKGESAESAVVRVTVNTVPPTPILLIDTTPTQALPVYADGTKSFSSLLNLSAADGTPITGGADGYTVQVLNENGAATDVVRASSVREIMDGVYLVTLTSTTPGTYRVTATWGTAQGVDPMTIVFSPVPTLVPDPDRSSLSVDPSRLEFMLVEPSSCGGIQSDSEVRITAVVMDGQGRPMPGVTVEFAVSNDAVVLSSATQTTDSLGIASVTATLSLPRATLAEQTVRVTASATGTWGEVELSEAEIALVRTSIRQCCPPGETCGTPTSTPTSTTSTPTPTQTGTPTQTTTPTSTATPTQTSTGPTSTSTPTQTTTGPTSTGTPTQSTAGPTPTATPTQTTTGPTSTGSTSTPTQPTLTPTMSPTGTPTTTFTTSPTPTQSTSPTQFTGVPTSTQSTGTTPDPRVTVPTGGTSTRGIPLSPIGTLLVLICYLSYQALSSESC